MLKKVVESIEKGLLDGNYTQVIHNLRRLGRPITKAWDAQPLQARDNTPESSKFTSNFEFKEFLVKQLDKPLVSSQDNQAAIQDLQNKLSRLALFIIVWKDNVTQDTNITESVESQEPESTINKKWLRQQIKFKASLDKNDRYAVHIALQMMVLELFQQSDHFIENEEWRESFKTLNKQDLPGFISKRLESLNKLSNKIINFNTEEEIEKMGEAIKAFQTPNLKKKLLKYFGISLAFIASLACGLATGGAIFLLFPSLPALVGIGLGALICLWGFSANYGFFSRNFPDFQISFLKKGGISEYLDPEGKRQQLSPIKKWLFIPLATLASITVGMGTVAITYTTVIALAAKLVPILAILWPPLPVIIVGILSAAIGMTLTVAVLTATMQAIKNSQNFSWKQFKESLSNLTAREIVGYVIKGLVVLVGLFGLAYFRYTAGIDLTNLFQPLVGSAAAIISGVMGLIAYIPQAFFTVVSIQKLIRVFSPSSTTSQQIPSLEESVSPPRSFFSRVRSGMSTWYTWVALIGNALGNAALVIVDSISPWSISGAVGGFFNSLSGNLIEPDRNILYRSQANAALAKEFNSLSTTTPEPKASTSAASIPILKGLPEQTLRNLPDSAPTEPPKSPKPSSRGHLSRSESDEPEMYSDKEHNAVNADLVVKIGLFPPQGKAVPSSNDLTQSTQKQPMNLRSN